MTKILIIADDLGIDSLTNERITDCFEKGLISSTSVMVTMPGFEEAVQWYKRQSLEPKLGIHLDLDGGKPVSDAFRTAYGDKKLFYPGGRLTADRKYLEILEQELDAQIQKLINSGIALHHIDSHHHKHTNWPVAKIVVRLAKKYGGVRIRVAGNVLYPSAFHKQVYRSLLNNYFKKHSNPQNHIPNFARLEKFMAVNPSIKGDSIELMTHPGMEQDYKLLNSQAFLDFLKGYSLIR
mgnify:CR=1 FL=1